MKKYILFLILILTFSIGIVYADDGDRSLQQMNGKRIGTLTGSVGGPAVKKNLPDSEIFYFDSIADFLPALQSEKIDAVCCDDSLVRFWKTEVKNLEILDGFLLSAEIAPIFPKSEKGQALADQYSEFVKKLWAEGTIDEIDAIWFGDDESKRTVLDYEALPDINGTLHMAADLSLAPFVMMVHNRIVGYDVDIAARFCEAYGYRLEIEPMTFSSIIPAVVSGKCDFAASDITVTQERAESVIFSEPVYRGGVVITVLNNDTETNPDQTGKSSGMSADLSDLRLDDLDGKRIGVQTGTNFEEMVKNRLPNAELFYFSNKADLISALSTNKIDSYVIDEPVIILEMQENDELTYIPEYLDTYDFAYVFPKNEEAEDLCEEFNEFLAEIKSDGRMDGLQKKWLSGDKSLWSIDDYGSFPATKGTLHLATETLYEPFEFIYEGKIMGFEIDLVVQFCKDYGYRLEIVNMNYDSVLPSIQSGKCEIGAAGISVTEERAESVLFSDPYYNGGTVMVVLKEEKSLPAEQPVSGGTSVFSSIKESFIKTFIREDRWKLFLEGVGITMLITLLSIFFGTIFGFLLFMLCRNGNPAANSITNTCLWLVQGMPGVVLLMILYYVIFGSSSISGIVVAVIGFTLIFGASVFGLLKIGVGTVDSGQYEAAFALGFSDIKTFFKIILPQALPHVMPAYKGEIISLLKATAIVGYIAVQDLTKMGDIVRSRTYEAFFPLIAVTIIYFLLEMFLGVIINRININIDMRKRNVKDILKGLTEND